MKLDKIFTETVTVCLSIAAIVNPLFSHSATAQVTQNEKFLYEVRQALIKNNVVDLFDDIEKIEIVGEMCEGFHNGATLDDWYKYVIGTALVNNLSDEQMSLVTDYMPLIAVIGIYNYCPQYTYFLQD